MARKCELLKERLAGLERRKLLGFITQFRAADEAAYSWPLWGAVFVMRGGCSDDSFSDFRGTLISHGREVYEAALDDPESLAEVDFGRSNQICYEGYQYVMHEVAEEQLGEIPARPLLYPDEPSGEEWDEDDLEQLYPRLTAKYELSDDRKSGAGKPWWKFW